MKRYEGWLLVFAIVWSGAVVSAATVPALLLDNFDKATKPNALGGDFGSWNIDPNDKTQFARDSFNQTNAYGGRGYSLRLDYDVDSPNPAYNGFWSKLPRVDLRAYKTLTFEIKGDALRGYSKQVRLELKSERQIGRYLLQGITDEWQRVSIPLEAFEGLTDRSRITEFVVVFDDLTVVPKVGTIYLDELYFE